MLIKLTFVIFQSLVNSDYNLDVAFLNFFSNNSDLLILTVSNMIYKTLVT